MAYITVTFIRHGETDLNQQGLVQGITDAPLNELGRKQSGLIGAHIANEKYTRVYSSDLKRAAETCQIILDHSKQSLPPMKLSAKLREKSFGEFEGKLIEDMKKTAIANQTDILRYNPPGGEPHESATARMVSFMEELFEICDNQECDNNNESEESILVVTHGMQLLSLLIHLNHTKNRYTLENLDVSTIIRQLPNTNRTILRIHKLENSDGGIRRCECVCFADGSHLEK